MTRRSSWTPTSAASPAKARCRVVLGRLAATFLRRQGQHALGFARLGDYSRERLGLSARELQSLAAVVERLARLPAIAAAFERGEVSWAQLRLLVGVALPETEAEWLARARGRTVRALAAQIGGREDPEPEDGEPRAHFRVRCPRRVARRWREVVGLARRMAGTELSQGQAAEAIAAEAWSAVPAWNGADAWLYDCQRPEGQAPDPEETPAAFAPDLDWAAVEEAIPEDVTRLAVDAEDLEAFALDERLRHVVQAMQRLSWQTGRLLRLFLDRRLYALMGFPSAARYLRERLGVSERKARALVALERKTWEAPVFGDAYRAGDLSWVRALALLPVLTESTAPAWIARAQSVTVRRLGDEVEWALAGRESRLPPPPDTNIEERQMCALPDDEVLDAEVAFTAPASVVALLRTLSVAFGARAVPLWQGFERLLAHVQDEWARQPRHRDPVFARGGWRCAVPACSARRSLHDHHLVFRSRGGDNSRPNRITVCAWHHLHGIHSGRIRAWGAAPHGVHWELGVRAGRPPLLRLEGERYVTGESPA